MVVDFFYILHPEGMANLVDHKMVFGFIYILHPKGMADSVEHKMVFDTSTKPYCRNPLVAYPVVSLDNFH